METRGVLQQCWWSLTAWLHCAIFIYKITATPTSQFSLSRPPFSLFFCVFSSVNDMMTYRILMETGRPGKWNPVQHHLLRLRVCSIHAASLPIYTFDYKTATHLSVYTCFTIYVCMLILYTVRVWSFFWGRLYIVSRVNVHYYSDINFQWYYSFYSQSWWHFFVFVFFFAFEMPRERKNPIK